MIRRRNDKFGNVIEFKTNEHLINIYLMLKGESRKRELGFINTATKIFNIKRQRERHLFRKYNAYGFNYYVLDSTKKSDTVRLEDEVTRWKIPIAWMLQKENGIFLHFQEGNFELQKFFSLDELKQFEIKEPLF